MLDCPVADVPDAKVVREVVDHEQEQIVGYGSS